ncbi:hypothetical protein [Paraglaciecola sp. 20A4]|uniref:hypothetical protein n=1 Tax=Paraglaciecola sp. 20A4 TaxID=2687288 RepID=UPI00140A5E42|nr:hypothetical protein [Paraglaciecola sp. 20A4]
MLLSEVRFSKKRLLKRFVALAIGFIAFGFCNSLQNDAYMPLDDSAYFALQSKMHNAEIAQQGLVQSYSGMFWQSL